jgi:NADH dehydrogenase/NADH:ubiquinone oxidoreductase subunit G
MVEITHGKRTRLVASCIYEAADGLEVKTQTERVLNVRKLVIELLLSRNPSHPVLRRIADGLGIQETRFDVEVKGCILCGQCIRTCREVVGVSAIGFEGRGVTRKVSTPFNESPPDCIACGSCAYACPVDVIPMKEKDGVRTIWKTDFPLQACTQCGRYFAPKKQLDHFCETVGLPKEHFDKCIHCR